MNLVRGDFVVDFFQGVVSEYLRADRSMFINTECLLQLQSEGTPKKKEHWYCDILAASFREKSLYLCEVSYAANLQKLVERLAAWSSHWTELCAAISRDSSIPQDWEFQPWVFLPEIRRDVLLKKFPTIPNMGNSDGSMPKPRITFLESVVPWKYRTWDRKVAELEDCE